MFHKLWELWASFEPFPEPIEEAEPLCSLLNQFDSNRQIFFCDFATELEKRHICPLGIGDPVTKVA